MLEVVFYRDGRKRRAGFVALGHTGKAPLGEDVVCAAVSAILQAARLGLERHARIKCAVRQRSGELRLRVPVAARSDCAVDAIVATAQLAIARIAKQYPKHVRYRSEAAKDG